MSKRTSHNGGRTYGIRKADRMAYQHKPYRILTVTDDGGASGWTEHIRSVEATSVSEALTMIERSDAGKLAVHAYGICPEDYAQARAEGIAFNDADGLLT